MSLQRNYYEVLGVPQTATTDQIKKKYRELARLHHPDVVKDKDMGQRIFSQINQAYRVLSDTERRAQYDSTMAAAAAAASGKSGSPSAPTAQAARPNGTAPYANGNGAKPYGNGNGATPYGNGNGATPYGNGAASAPQAQPVPAQKLEAIAGLLSHADNAIMAGKPVEAGAFCMKVLEIDPRSMRALDIFGDALTQQGKREDAAVQYRKALQIAPSHSIQAKLNRLVEAAPSNRTNPIGQTPPPPKKPDPAPSADKAGGLFGRFLGRK